MTIEATFVQGDTAPAIIAQLHDEAIPTIPIDLTTALGVKFQMRRPDDRKFTVNAAADVTDPPNGLVSYSWAADDLGVPGEYDAQWEITYADGKIQTTASPNRILVRRQ